jgi:hypothetical protein
LYNLSSIQESSRLERFLIGAEGTPTHLILRKILYSLQLSLDLICKFLIAGYLLDKFLKLHGLYRRSFDFAQDDTFLDARFFTQIGLFRLNLGPRVGRTSAGKVAAKSGADCGTAEGGWDPTVLMSLYLE